MEHFLINFSIVQEQFLEREEPITVNSFALYSCICRKFQIEFIIKFYADIFALECDSFIFSNLLGDRWSQKWLTRRQGLYINRGTREKAEKKLRVIHILYKPFLKQD